MPAVGFLFGLTDASRAAMNLTNINGSDIVTPWGSRLISADDELCREDTDCLSGYYHMGNVWPLFSGWLAQADYQYGRAADGYYLLMTIIKKTYDNALGSIGEVFRRGFMRAWAARTRAGMKPWACGPSWTASWACVWMPCTIDFPSSPRFHRI